MTYIKFDAGPLADVSCEADGDRWTLVFVRDFHQQPDTVWAALTDPTKLAAWSPYTVSRDLGATGDATLTMIDGDVAENLLAHVTVAEAPTVLEYTWATDMLRWELAATSSGTRLTLRHTMQDRDWVPKVAAGWHLCLVVAEHLLDGDPIAPIRGNDARNYGWEQLDRDYGEKLGIASSGWPS